MGVIHRRPRSSRATPAGPSSTSPCSFAKSDIARSVRTHLLDAEEDLRASYVSLDRRVTRIEGCLLGVGSALQELGPVLGRMSQRLESLDRKFDRTHQVVGAISLRLTDVSQDIVRLDARMEDLARRLRDVGRRRNG